MIDLLEEDDCRFFLLSVGLSQSNPISMTDTPHRFADRLSPSIRVRTYAESIRRPFFFQKNFLVELLPVPAENIDMTVGDDVGETEGIAFKCYAFNDRYIVWVVNALDLLGENNDYLDSIDRTLDLAIWAGPYFWKNAYIIVCLGYRDVNLLPLRKDRKARAKIFSQHGVPEYNQRRARNIHNKLTEAAEKADKYGVGLRFTYLDFPSENAPSYRDLPSIYPKLIGTVDDNPYHGTYTTDTTFRGSVPPSYDIERKIDPLLQEFESFGISDDHSEMETDEED